MARRGVTLKELSRRLDAIGVKIASPQLSNKVGRGSFSFFFFLQCMKALEADFVRLADEPPQPPKRTEKDIKALTARLRAAIK